MRMTLLKRKKKKRTDFDRICNIVVSEKTCLSNDEIVVILSKLYTEGILKIKCHDAGPISYNINNDYKRLNTHKYSNNVREEAKKSDNDMELEYEYSTCKENI